MELTREQTHCPGILERTAMLDLSIHQLSEIVSGQLSLGTMGPFDGDLQPVGRVVTNSHEVAPGDLFWGLEGNASNGAEEAMVRAAQGTVVAGQHIEPWAGRFSIRVPHAGNALLELGRWKRHHLDGTVIGTAGEPHSMVTASLTQQLLQPLGCGDCGDAPLLHEAELALAMLQWNDESPFAIADLGPIGNSEFAKISHLCSPEIIAINSPRKVTHQESLRDSKAFAKTYARFLDILPRDTTVIINGDDFGLRKVVRNSGLETVSVGRNGNSDLMATNVSCRNGQLAFDVDGTRFQFPFWGRHFLPQTLAAIAIGRLLSVPLDTMQAAAHSARLPRGFGDLRPIAGITLIDDSRAASPASLEVGLESLSEMPTPGRRWVVCGQLNMDEPRAVGQCRRMGRMLVTRCSSDRLICCGTESAEIADAAIAAGMPRHSASVCPTGTAAAKQLADELMPGDIVLVSDNRSSEMKTVTQYLTARRSYVAA